MFPAGDGGDGGGGGVRPPRLTRDVVIGTAIEFIDEHGLPGLSMRRLGKRLGVEAMAPYHHVPSRDALLDGVVDALVEEMRDDRRVPERVEGGWQEFLVRLADGVRRVAVAPLRSFPVVASRPAEALWLGPPLRSLYPRTQTRSCRS